MSKKQSGFAHILVLILLIVGLGVGLYLVTHPTFFKPRASISGPVMPTSTFSLSADRGGSSYAVGDQVTVSVYVNSDVDAANLFSEKIHYNNTLLRLDRLDYTGSFVQNWVEQFSDQAGGRISLVGGVPTPGLQTMVDQPKLMAKIQFTALAEGSAAVTTDSTSAIYRNSDNANILVLGSTSNTTVVVGGNIFNPPASAPVSATASPSPTSTPTPIPSATPAVGAGNGDGNSDGAVNLVDLSILLSNYNKHSGFPAAVDLNGDGVINTFDFSLILGVLRANHTIN